MKNIETYKYYIANNEYAIKNFLGLHRNDKITSLWWNDNSFLISVTYANFKTKSIDYLHILFTSLDSLMESEKDYFDIDNIADDLYHNDNQIYLKAVSCNEESVVQVLIAYLIKKYSLKDKNNPYTLGGSLAVSYAYDIISHIRDRSRVYYEAKN